MMNSKPALDSEKLLNEYRGLHEGLRSMISQFAVTSNEIIVEMETAILDENIDLMKRLAHKLKGSTSYFYADLVTQLAHELENIPTSTTIKEIVALIGALRKELERLNEALSDIKATIK